MLLVSITCWWRLHIKLLFARRAKSHQTYMNTFIYTFFSSTKEVEVCPGHTVLFLMLPNQSWGEHLHNRNKPTKELVICLLRNALPDKKFGWLSRCIYITALFRILHILMSDTKRGVKGCKHCSGFFQQRLNQRKPPQPHIPPVPALCRHCAEQSYPALATKCLAYWHAAKVRYQVW